MNLLNPALLAGSLLLAGATLSGPDIASQQTPGWSDADRQFLLHGSMGSEFIPESVLKAFIATYPDLFPTQDFSHLGMIPDSAFGWPIGMSRAERRHLGGLTSVGINCASCHVAEIESGAGSRLRILGVTSHFNVEAFYGSIIISTFRTADPANMQPFLGAYLNIAKPISNQVTPAHRIEALNARWAEQKDAILKAMSADPAAGAGPGSLHDIKPMDLNCINVAHADLPALASSMLKLFHNIRAGLHVPDAPPTEAPPASGPGRNDAFGLLAVVLLHSPQGYAPSKFGVVWNMDQRRWVHWDGGTQSPLARNLLASLGLGAPLVDGKALLDFDLVKHQTEITEKIRPPKYPFDIDRAAAARGKTLYERTCAKCHDGPEDDSRLHGDIGTDPLRAELFSPSQAAKFGQFLADVKVDGYTPMKDGLRGTQKYWSPRLEGVWARSPYLHNGSVRTMKDLLTPPSQRPTSMHRGSRIYDETAMGYTDDGPYILDNSSPGSSNAGHDYGTDLSESDKKDLIEFLKSL